MTGVGEYRKQMAALVAAAKLDNLDFEDIIPDNMQIQFLQGTGIKEARNCIKDLQKREEELLAANEALSENLKNFPSTEADLQQARRQIVNLKSTIEDLTKRVERYRHQAKEIVDVKRTDAAAAEKIERLQMQTEDQQIIIEKLMEDNRISEAMFQQLREADENALKRKDSLLTKKDKELKLLVQQAQEMVELTTLHDIPCSVSRKDEDKNMPVGLLQIESFAMQTENIELLEQNLRLLEKNEILEEHITKLQEQLSEAVPSKQFSDRGFAGIVSETKTLWRFYQSSSEIIASLAECFYPSKVDIPSLKDVCTRLDAAQNALTGYHEVKEVVRDMNALSNSSTEHAALFIQLDSLAAVAFESAMNLESLYSGLWCFFDNLAYDPKILSDLNASSCDIDRAPCFDLMSCDSVCSKSG